MDRIIFERRGLNKILESLKKEKSLFNFLNAYSIYLFRHNKNFRESVSNKPNFYAFPDGIIISIYHLFRYGRWLNRTTGPETTEFILNNAKLIKNKKHFFLGITEHNVRKLINRFDGLKTNNIRYYNPPYITGDVFPKEEKNKIINKINKEKVDFLWVGLGNPKQEIISYQIFKKVRAKNIFNVGAAFDFFSGRKKRAPRIFRKLGLEWLFRFMTDYNYSKHKIKKSIISILYIMKSLEFRD